MIVSFVPSPSSPLSFQLYLIGTATVYVELHRFVPHRLGKGLKLNILVG